MYTHFATARVAARSIVDFLQEGKKKYSLRPWNRHKPDETLWWIVPSSEWPAYHLGKFFCSPEGDNIMFGLYVEKGMGVSTQGFYDAKLQMNASWQWNSFIQDIQSGKLDRALSSVSMPLYLFLGGSIITGGFDPSAPKPDTLLFTIDGGHLTLEQEKLTVGELAPLTTMKQLTSLPKVLKEIKSLDWLWLDVMVGTRLRRPEDGADLSDAMDAGNLVRNLFEPLMLWLGEAQ